MRKIYFIHFFVLFFRRRAFTLPMVAFTLSGDLFFRRLTPLHPLPHPLDGQGGAAFVVVVEITIPLQESYFQEHVPNLGGGWRVVSVMPVIRKEGHDEVDHEFAFGGLRFGDHDIQIVEGDGFVRMGNVQKMHIAFVVDLAFLHRVADMLGDDRTFFSEKVGHLRLRKPDRFLLQGRLDGDRPVLRREEHKGMFDWKGVGFGFHSLKL